MGTRYSGENQLNTDGGDRTDEVRVSFDHLFPKMSRHGVYIVEDMHGPNDFTRYAHEIADLLSAKQFAADEMFARMTYAVHFYESMVVFERGHSQPYKMAV